MYPQFLLGTKERLSLIELRGGPYDNTGMYVEDIPNEVVIDGHKYEYGIAPRRVGNAVDYSLHYTYFGSDRDETAE